MKVKNSHLHLVLMAACVLTGPVMMTERPAGASIQPAAGDGIEAGTKAIARARAAYTSMKSYKDSFEVSWEWKSEEFPEQRNAVKGTNTWVSPNKLRSEGANAAIVCDGTTLTLHDINARQFRKMPQPPGAELNDAVGEFPQGQWLFSSIAAILMRGDSNPELLLRMMKKVTGSKPEVRNGVPGVTVEGAGIYDPDDPTITTPTKLSMWFRDSDGLMAWFQLDTTEASNALGAVEYDSVTWSCTFENIGVNTEIAPETFTFTPRATDREVESFEMDADAMADRGGSQTQLIGSPAPALGAPDLEGKTVGLEEYKGRVVVLDFWATWCGPCVAAMPHVQKLSEKYADRPVTVLGINQDRGDTEKVEKFIASKKITFRQVMDDGTIGQSYLVQGIPCTVLIDKDGVVQDVQTGFSGEAEVIRKIDKLLEGKPIHTAAEIAAFREDAEREANAPALAFPAANAERLTDAGRLGQGFFHRFQSRAIDIDGDGKVEIVTPSETSLQYIDETGESIKTIRLKGLGRGHIDAFQPVRLDGKTHWVVSFSVFGMDRDDRSMSIGFFDQNGTKLWGCTPDAPERTFMQASLAAGDLTGDGVPEIVVGLEGTRLGGDGQLDFNPKSQAGAVLVLDRAGNTLVQRSFKEQVNLVFVGVPPKAGEPASLTVVLNQRVQKLKLDLDAKAESGKKDVKP